MHLLRAGAQGLLALAPEQQQRLDSDLHALLARFARNMDPLVVPSDHLEAVITRA